MKIAFIYDMIYPYNIGGVEKRNHVLCEALAEKGHEVHVFCKQLWSGNATLVQNKVIYHGLYKSKPVFNRNIFDILRFSVNLLFVRLRDFDVVDTSSFPYLNFFPLKFKTLFSQTKLFVTWHEFWGNYWNTKIKLGFVGKFVEKIVLSFSKNNFAVSKSVNRFVNGVLIYNPIVVPKMSRVNKKYDLIYSGRLLAHKNVHFIIDLLSKNKKLTAAIIGEGPEKDNLIRYAFSKKVSNRIKFYDFVDEFKYYELMNQSKIYVNCSSLEGFGISSLEALALNLNLLVYNDEANSTKEFIDNDYIFDDIDDLNKKVAHLLSKKVIQKFNQKMFDVKSICESLERSYND